MAPPCHSGPHPDVVGWRSRLSSRTPTPSSILLLLILRQRLIYALQIAWCATRAPETVLLSGTLGYKRYMPQFETYVHSPTYVASHFPPVGTPSHAQLEVALG